jgi:hypothetical protein
MHVLGATLLIIDDDIVRKLCGTEDSGFNALQASMACKVLRYLSASSLNLLDLRLRMPQVDLELIHRSPFVACRPRLLWCLGAG